MLGLKTMSETNKGVLFMLAGLVLLLHTLGILRTGLNYILIITSLYLLAYGFIKLDGMKYINKMIGK